MPVINFSYKYFNQVLGQEITKEDLIDMLPMIGSDIEHYDDEMVKVEFFPNRPRLLQCRRNCSNSQGISWNRRRTTRIFHVKIRLQND